VPELRGKRGREAGKPARFNQVGVNTRGVSGGRKLGGSLLYGNRRFYNYLK
jgi:hypothetical protein